MITVHEDVYLYLNISHPCLKSNVIINGFIRQTSV